MSCFSLAWGIGGFCKCGRKVNRKCSLSFVCWRMKTFRAIISQMLDSQSGSNIEVFRLRKVQHPSGTVIGNCCQGVKITSSCKNELFTGDSALLVMLCLHISLLCRSSSPEKKTHVDVCIWYRMPIKNGFPKPMHMAERHCCRQLEMFNKGPSYLIPLEAEEVNAIQIYLYKMWTFGTYGSSGVPYVPNISRQDGKARKTNELWEGKRAPCKNLVEGSQQLWNSLHSRIYGTVNIFCEGCFHIM